MIRITAALLAVCFAACTPEILDYAAGEATPTPAPDPGCIAAELVDSDAGRITGDLVVCGELDAGGVDFYTVVNTGPEDLELHVETFGGDTGCLGDTDILVEDLSGNVVTFDEELGIGPCAWVTIPIAARQSLVVKVAAVEAGPYRLAVELFAL